MGRLCFWAQGGAAGRFGAAEALVQGSGSALRWHPQFILEDQAEGLVLRQGRIPPPTARQQVDQPALGGLPERLHLDLLPGAGQGQLQLAALIPAICQQGEGFQGQAAQALALHQRPFIEDLAVPQGKAGQELPPEQRQSRVQLAQAGRAVAQV